jgi:hypothetical protein
MLRSGGFPEVAQEEVVEAAFAMVAAKETEAQQEVLDVSAVRAGRVLGLTVGAIREAVHSV